MSIKQIVNHKLRSNQKGFSLTEVMVAVIILTTGVLGIFSFVTTGVRASDLAQDYTVAINHAEYTLEEMNTLETLEDITTTNWSNWATANNLNTLTNETINVAFADTESDPLNILVTVTWETGQRTLSVNLTTEMSK